jgi:hypothetical protein
MHEHSFPTRRSSDLIEVGIRFHSAQLNTR